MQLAIVAVLILTLEVVNAVSNVGRLLYLGKETTRADGMDASCRKEEAIALLNIIAGNGIHNGVVCHHFGILRRCNLLLQSAQQSGVLVAVEQIPHLGLATFFTLTLGYLVGWMYLYGQILTCVDELDEQRKLVAETLVVVLSYKFLLQNSHNII